MSSTPSSTFSFFPASQESISIFSLKPSTFFLFSSFHKMYIQSSHRNSSAITPDRRQHSSTNTPIQPIHPSIESPLNPVRLVSPIHSSISVPTSTKATMHHLAVGKDNRSSSSLLFSLWHGMAASDDAGLWES
ncbi:unnamed protein product [Linum trigynum]|uniref:Uncharacterized protein n=2 Tax=Linum trigynum TaxID=586398 RepID=A0AAV2CNY8_9ROSI